MSDFDLSVHINDLSILPTLVERKTPTARRMLHVLVRGHAGEYIVDYTAQAGRWVRTLSTVPWQATIGIDY